MTGFSPDGPSDLTSSADAASPSGSAVCSAKGCRAPGAWALIWNNPRIHHPDREKRWLACDAHREHLAQFLDLRGFLRQVVPAHSEA